MHSASTSWQSSGLYRYSDRLAGLISIPNYFVNLLAEVRRSKPNLLDLTISNPTEALRHYPHDEISRVLGEIKNFDYQPEPFGSLEARRAIIESQEHKVALEHIALTASTSEAYGLLFKLLANPGDEVLAPTPSYPLFDFLSQLEGVKLQTYNLRYDGSWFIDFASLEAAVSNKSRALILVNPNNPTGSNLQEDEYRRLISFSAQHRLPLISDEVFTDYSFNDSTRRLPTLNGRHEVLNFTLNGLSKSAGMPQMKLGWIVANGPLKARNEACARLELILDTYLSVNAPVQLAARELLEIGKGIQELIRRRVKQNLQTLDELTACTKLHRLNSEGGWSAILRVPDVMNDEEWATRLLVSESVVVQPGYFFDLLDGVFLVVSLIVDEDSFREGVQRMMSFVENV